MKDSFNIDGKTYISSRRAAEIAKYSNDYVGQLCRGGKVASRMVGRTWFVDQESILEHKRMSEEAFQARCRSVSREQQKVFATASGAVAIPVFPQPSWNITYGADERPLMPTIQKVVQKPTQIPTLEETKARSQTLRNALIVAIIAVVIVGGGVFVKNDSERFATVDGTSQPAHVYASVERIIQAVGSGFGQMLAMIERTFSKKSDYAANQVMPTIPANGNSWNGMAVVPSSADNQAATDQIRNSFSDLVEVSPDQSGTAGVITPVFKKATGDEFLYVLVPVTDKAETTNQ